MHGSFMVAENPGERIKEMMTERGWSQAELAYVLGVPPATVNQLVNAKRPITPEIAKLLSLAFDHPAESFVDMQTRWSLQNTPEPDGEVRTRALAQSAYPLRAMAKRGWIKSAAEGANAHSELCRFFGVNTLDNLETIGHAAKKSTEGGLTGEQVVWLYRVRKIAREMVTPDYDPAKLREAIEALEQLRGDPEAVRYVPRLLNKAGVRFVVVEALPGSKIDGVCLWLNRKSPVIGLSLRFDRIDNFWFVLRHECAHVLHGHGQDGAILDADLDGDVAASINEEERIANTEAADFCVPAQQMTSFYLRKRPFFAEREVVAFAKRVGVHPGLVVGQLQRKMDRYDFLRRHLVNVRNFLAGAMMMDGWGDTVPVD